MRRVLVGLFVLWPSFLCAMPAVYTGSAWQTHTDLIPDFAKTPTIHSVKAGSWNDATVWNPARVPTAADIVVVKHGVTWTTATAKVIGIAAGASLSCTLTGSSTLTVGTLQVQPGGSFLCASASAPLPASFKAEIVIANVALDATADPGQYGTGLLAMDSVVQLFGSPKTPFVRLATEPLAGQNTLTLATVPTGWRVGDDLALPDTRQLTDAELMLDADGARRRRISSQTEFVRIASIAGTTVTLTEPIQFHHRGARTPEGVLTFLPHVANTTRNILMRSESAAGTRGHVFLTGDGEYDVEYTQFSHLGRTKAEPLTPTNVKGRYPLHIHHVPGLCDGRQYQFKAVGNAIEDGLKWALTVHNSHYGLIAENVIVDANGAGIVTEDGSESFNVFDRNFIANIWNVDQGVNAGADAEGRHGNGFWVRGPNNSLTNNVVADTLEAIGIYVGVPETGPQSAEAIVRIPTKQCGDTAMEAQEIVVGRLSNQAFTNNEMYSSTEVSLGTWWFAMANPPRIPFKDTTIWHFYGTGIYNRYWNGIVDGVRMRNEGGTGFAWLQNNNRVMGEQTHSEILRADVQGVETLYRRDGQLSLAPSYLIADSLFRSKQGFLLDGRGQDNQGNTSSSQGASKFVFRNVRFQPLPNTPLVAMQLSESQGSDRNNFLKDFTVEAHQGDATKNYRVFYQSQAPSAPGPSLTNAGGGTCTLGTNQDCFNADQPVTYQMLATSSNTLPEFVGAFVSPINAQPPQPQPCTWMLSSASASVPATGGSVTVSTTASPIGCTGTLSVSGGATWASATINGATVTVTAQANTLTTARTASFTIGGNAFALNQTGASVPPPVCVPVKFVASLTTDTKIKDAILAGMKEGYPPENTLALSATKLVFVKVCN